MVVGRRPELRRPARRKVTGADWVLPSPCSLLMLFQAPCVGSRARASWERERESVKQTEERQRGSQLFSHSLTKLHSIGLL